MEGLLFYLPVLVTVADWDNHHQFFPAGTFHPRVSSLLEGDRRMFLELICHFTGVITHRGYTGICRRHLTFWLGQFFICLRFYVITLCFPSWFYFIDKIPSKFFFLPQDFLLNTKHYLCSERNCLEQTNKQKSLSPEWQKENQLRLKTVARWDGHFWHHPDAWVVADSPPRHVVGCAVGSHPKLGL